jgi:iron(III) transport system substrate-binding protein
MRIKALLVVFALLATATVVSCKRQTSSTRLLIYTPHGQDMLRDFINRYKEQYPSADVQFLDMGSRQILERVTIERNRPQADLWWGASHTTFQTAADQDLLAEFRPSWATDVPSESRDEKGRWFGTYETPQVIAYNNEAVKAGEAPRDWDDVIDAKWRDKVLIRNPTPSDTMRTIFGAMIYRFYKDTRSQEQGFEWLRKLDANVHEYTADGTLLMQKIGRREGLITLWDMPDVRLFKEQKGLPVDYVIPASGTPIVIDGIAIIKGAPNEEEAKRFYEFVTTQDSLVYTAQKYYRLPIRESLDRSKLPNWMNEPFIRMPLDWELLRKEGDEWLKYWDTNIRGRGAK